MEQDTTRVCPVELADSLDNRIRRWVQNPRKILAPYVAEGMTALDMGCGPGFFSIELARLVGPSGRVVAADLQQGMLDKVRTKIKGTELEGRVHLVKCDQGTINVTDPVDFILTFFMVHEVPDQPGFFRQIVPLLRSSGKYLLVEPKLFHVSQVQFSETLQNARAAGFEVSLGPKLPFSWSAVLSRSGSGAA
jgi:ubiquinone/menaquinone biosynthesis C-methylase UbiE